MQLRHCLAVLALSCASFSWAASQVQVVGLFPGAAVVNVDGQRKLVRVGDTGPGGVQVVSVDKQGAVLRVDGVERVYPMSREYSAGFAEPVKKRLSIAKGIGGHYWVAGSVNGQTVQFLVDTGATSVALNDAHAKRLGIDYRVSGRPLQVSTASGVTRGWRVMLDRVKIGDLEVLGVEAVVLEGGAPHEALLGMSFLGRVGWREEQGMLVLESKL
ncbi:aspartyl protease-like protein [Ectopseudomonas mendocina]|jgi:aspartyl protease family protein|uniref:Aspartyl protease-like protein n=2 Tax=Ectopseudomonas mendocina TaxID=300 RepID=A0A379IQF7_ECTME|nr:MULTISPECIES: TIGR02281 family clan AA aspartic protease [Pseudomonas]MBL0951991.1 TIGR02281 family clan AA aspartic protease [Pseudomonas sp.]AEB60264.1 aspartyl protease-like protein [Pseudomonas mendocina NK-01]ALN17756.1 aspartyl protease [Pseudomonas mendocina S5.2]KES01429.1 aspartyl protease [Pseudomonas mendocina]QTN47169.1 TIGR02281 family clan AA aspartic protease [Pseudomonas mendocina]